MTNRILRSAAVVIGLVASSIVALAQLPPGDSDYKLAPAITGDRSRVFVGTQYGTILIGTSTPNGISVTDSLVRRGNGPNDDVLPPELRGVWHLSMPNRTTHPDLVVALVSYLDGSASRYGILRSTDFGASWTLIKDAALADPMFVPSNSFWTWTTLREVTWLPDAQNGWVFGPKGIVATTDGGLTWNIRYSQGGEGTSQVQALAFRDPLNGLAVIGWAPEERPYITTDGGLTFAPRYSPLGVNRITQLNWLGNEYRGMGFDRTAKTNHKATTYIYRTDHEAIIWDVKQKGNITVEQSYHTEILWTDDRTGVMVNRSGELWATTNAGVNWFIVQDADSVGYRMPVSTNSGYGYASITLDNRYIVQASTLSNNGSLYRLMQWGLRTSGVEETSPSVFDNTNLIPTPSLDRVRIALDRETSTAARVIVIDATGSVVLIERPGAGHRSLAIDISTLQTGHYRLMVDDGDRRIVAPLLIAR